MSNIKLFNRWDYNGLKIEDISLVNNLAVGEKFANFLPHTQGKYACKKFKKSQCPLIERFVCAMMMHGRNSGKKLKAIRILRDSFELINLITNENPIQILINAVVNSGPREDSTRIGSTGSIRRQAVDVSPLRRVNIGIQLLAKGTREASFKSIKSIAECLADELINASKGSSNSFAVKKKDEIERVAKASR